MKVDVEALNDNCRYCPRLEIETFSVWDKPYYKDFRCKYLEDCMVVEEMIKGAKMDERKEE